MSKITVTPITNGQDLSSINNNFASIAAALNTGVFWKNNPIGEDNMIQQDTDYNGHKLYNVTDITVNGVSLIVSVNAAAASATAALASQVAANVSAAASGVSANAAAISAAQAVTTLSTSLLKTNNLSDVTNAATARTNLGLPIGTSGATVPLLNGTNTWSNLQTFSSSVVAPLGVILDNTVASGQRNLTYKTSGSLRWNANVTQATESGSNAGSDYAIGRYTDAGAFIDNPFSINRATGAVTIPNAVFTTTSGLTSTSVGLGNVNNTSDVNKPVSTAQAAANATKTPLIQSATGVGQIVSLHTATNTAVVLPAGGTWAWFVQCFNTSTGAMGIGVGSPVGVSAGGATIQAAVASFQFEGFAIRIT